MLKRFKDNKENDGLRMFEARRHPGGFQGGALPANRSYVGGGHFPARRLQTNSYLRKQPAPTEGASTIPGANGANLPNLRHQQKVSLPAHTLSVYSSVRPSTTPYTTRGPANPTDQYPRLWTPKTAGGDTGELAGTEPAEGDEEDPHLFREAEPVNTAPPKVSMQQRNRQGAPLVPQSYSVHSNNAQLRNTFGSYGASGHSKYHLGGHQHAKSQLGQAHRSSGFKGAGSSPSKVKHAFQESSQTAQGYSDLTKVQDHEDEEEGARVGERKLTKREIMLQREVSFNTRVSVTDITLPTYDARMDIYCPSATNKRFNNAMPTTMVQRNMINASEKSKQIALQNSKQVQKKHRPNSGNRDQEQQGQPSKPQQMHVDNNNNLYGRATVGVVKPSNAGPKQGGGRSMIMSMGNSGEMYPPPNKQQKTVPLQDHKVYPGGDKPMIAKHQPADVPIQPERQLSQQQTNYENVLDVAKRIEEIRVHTRHAIRDGCEDTEYLATLYQEGLKVGLEKNDRAMIDIDDMLWISRVPHHRTQLSQKILGAVGHIEVDGPPWRVLGGVYDVIKVVGEGAYGMVMKSQHRETKQVVAVKEFKINDDDPDAEEVRRTSKREVALLKSLKNRNIVRYLAEFYEREKLYVVMEFVPRNLLEVLEAHTCGLHKEAVRQCMYQLCKAITFIHKQDIVYRDIKPENVLIDAAGTLKLCDFGFARKLNSDQTVLTDYVATRWYRAPELLLGPPFRNERGQEVRSPYGKGVDMWAIGCLLGELTDGEPLFAGDSDVDQLLKIQKVQGHLTRHQTELFMINPNNSGIHFNVDRVEPLESRYLGKMDQVTLNFMHGVLHIDPKKRLTSEKSLRHPYFYPLHNAA